MTLVHLVGAQFCFIVYLICEAAALFDRRNVSEMAQGERHLRFGLLITGGAAMAMFGVVYSTLFFLDGKTSPYVRASWIHGNCDLYKRSWHKHKAYLVRPAAGMWKILKVTSYVAEYTVTMSILLSHLVIWFYFRKSLFKPAESHGLNGIDVGE